MIPPGAVDGSSVQAPLLAPDSQFFERQQHAQVAAAVDPIAAVTPQPIVVGLILGAAQVGA